MLVHVARNVGHVEVGVGLVCKLLELGIERFLCLTLILDGNQGRGTTHASKADFVAEKVEATDASLSIVEVVVLDETETRHDQQ